MDIKSHWSMKGTILKGLARQTTALPAIIAALVVQYCLSACCPKCPEPEPRIIYREKPRDILLEKVRTSQTDDIRELLTPLLEDPVRRCLAAYYLCVFDGTRKEYVKVLYDDSCKREIPGEVRVIKNLVYWEKRARKCIRQNQDTSGALEKCQEDNELLTREIERIQFEYKKKEEIRKEAEKWRFK